MKNNTLCKALLATVFSLIFCNQQVSSQSTNGDLGLNDELDTLSFVIGIAQSQGMKEYLVESMDVDTAYVDDFIQGLSVGANGNADPSRKAFFAGIQIGQQIGGQMITGVNNELFGADSGKSISLTHFLSGFVLGIDNSSDEELLSEAAEDAQRLMEKIKVSNTTPEQKAYKKKNEDWLAANKVKPGVRTTTSGLQYKIIKKGTGAIPSGDDLIVCHYQGRLVDGTVFDNSYERKEPITFRPNQVIKGWEETLTMMPVGSVWEIYIPQSLANGNRQQGQIPPYSTLIFKIELMEMTKE